MTDNVALRSMMGDLLGDLAKERRYTGQRAQLPPPQPGTTVQEPTTGVGGSAATFADISTIPAVQNQYYSDRKTNAYYQLEWLSPILSQGWVDTDQGAAAVFMSGFRGGPSKAPGQYSTPQDGLSANLTKKPYAYY